MRSGKVLLDLALAGLASLALSRLASEQDALRGTLLLLPFVVAALALLGRRSGLRNLDRYRGVLELTASFGIVLLALSRRALGLALDDELLIAALALVLAMHLARRLPSLRPLLGKHLPKRPDAIFFLLPCIVYLAILPWSAQQHPPDGDEPYYLLITHSLAEDFDADLADDYDDGASLAFLERRLEPQPGDPVGDQGELYSRHNLLLPLVLAPAYRIGGKLGALVVMAFLTALLAWWTLRLARHYFADSPGAALCAWALLAFTPPLLLYSYQVWVEVPAALLSVIALDLALAQRSRAPGLRGWLLLFLPIALLPILKIRFMLLAAPLAVLAWWHAGRPRRLLVLGIGAIGTLSTAILIHNIRVYGNALKIHSWKELDPFVYPVSSYLGGASGIFFDCAFGLFATAPIWLILAAAAVPMIRRRHALLVHGLIFAGPYLAIVVPRLEWFGGWSPPFRYPLVILPWLALSLVPLFSTRRGAGARAILAGLGALTLALSLLWIAHPGWTYNFANGRTYLLDHLGVRFGTDIVALFPSSTRLRTATWAWPAIALPLTAALWWGWRRPRRGAPGWGVAAILLALGALPTIAAQIPTRIIEFEDAHVKKRGGHMHPFRWVIERPRYPGGWVLREGDSLTAPVFPAGREAHLRLHLRYVRNSPSPLSLEVRVGERRIGLWHAQQAGDWQWLELESGVWKEQARLVLAVHGPPGMAPTNGVIVDRMELEWR